MQWFSFNAKVQSLTGEEKKGAVLKLADDANKSAYANLAKPVPGAWELVRLSEILIDSLTPEQQLALREAIDAAKPVPVLPALATQHDFGTTKAIAISTTSGVQAHLEGGAGFLVDGNLVADSWQATILNTTDLAQSFAFANCTCFVRDGQAIAPKSSPISIPPNSAVLLQLVKNGGTNWLQVIALGSVSAATSPVELASIAIGNMQEKQRSALQSAIGVAPEFVFTKQGGIKIGPSSKVFINEPGDIEIWNGGSAGQSFTVVDPYRLLQGQSNKVIAPAAQTIAAGQLKSEVTATNEFDLNAVGSGFVGGIICFVLDFTGLNWAIDLAWLNASSGNSASTPLPRISIVDSPAHVSTIDDEVILSAQFN